MSSLKVSALWLSTEQVQGKLIFDRAIMVNGTVNRVDTAVDRNFKCLVIVRLRRQHWKGKLYHPISLSRVS